MSPMSIKVMQSWRLSGDRRRYSYLRLQQLCCRKYLTSDRPHGNLQMHVAAHKCGWE